MSELTHIPVIIDKSHLLTIGERLYSTSLDLIRELVSNAYDADATRIDITLTPTEIVVADNGSGMSKEQLQQYLTIGSQEKRLHNTSPRFHRNRIGEFGIGKFSVLTIAERFIIETQQYASQFRAKLIFDTLQWQRDPTWSVPCEILSPDVSRGDGTVITLTNIKKPLESGSVIRHIRERMPLGRDDFRIFVNETQVTAASIPGKRFPFSYTTQYGLVEGEVILANIPVTQRNMVDAGVTIRVKDIAVTKSLFGFETSHAVGASRLRGWVNADFLPITSSRDNVIQDTQEYRIVYEKVREVLQKVLREARNLSFQKENAQASQVLRDALDKIGKAFKKNPSALPEQLGEPSLGVPPFPGARTQEGYVISKAQFVITKKPMHNPIDDPFQSIKQAPKRRNFSLANRAIIRKMHFANIGIICRMERFGADYPPSFLEEGVILINIDHPLYRRQMDNGPLLTMFICSLISKELALKKNPHDAQAAFQFQHQLLTDAFRDVRKI